MDEPYPNPMGYTNGKIIDNPLVEAVIGWGRVQIGILNHWCTGTKDSKIGEPYVTFELIRYDPPHPPNNRFVVYTSADRTFTTVSLMN